MATVVVLFSLLFSLASDSGGWILWDHTTYKRFFEKGDPSDLTTWDIYGGFESAALCYTKAESVFRGRDAFFSSKPKNDQKEPITYLGATSEAWVLDMRKLSDQPITSGPVSIVTRQHFVCLPSDFDPREKNEKN